jgi:hypothetical protein
VRTGKFRLGDDQLLVDARGKSWISMEDYAIALVDELETPTSFQIRLPFRRVRAVGGHNSDIIALDIRREQYMEVF